MNKLLFTTLTLTTILASCGPKKTTVYTGEYKNKIVLSAFNDMVSKSTLDESQLTGLPKLIDFSAQMTDVRNQSNRGVCTIFSTMGIIEGTIKKDLGIDVNLSEEYLNYAEKKFGSVISVESSTVSNNILAMQKGGLLLEDDWSYQSSWFKKDLPCEEFVNSGAKTPKICFSHNSPNNKTLARIINAKDIKFFTINKNTTEIIKFLANNKRPLSIYLTVNFKGWSNSGEVEYNEKLRQECLKKPSECGAHSVILTGYDMNKRVFKFKNSWGKNWGENGYGTISFDVVDKYVTAQLHYAKVEGQVKIPKTLNSKLKIVKFEASNLRNADDSIKINIETEINETNGKMFLITNELEKKHKEYSNERPNIDNTNPIVLREKKEQKITGYDHVRFEAYYIPKEGSKLIINSGDRPVLTIPSSIFSTSAVKKIIDDNNHDLIIKSTIYIHDDEVGYRFLKHIYTPLN